VELVQEQEQEQEQKEEEQIPLLSRGGVARSAGVVLVKKFLWN